jgi:hypothetical protein
MDFKGAVLMTWEEYRRWSTTPSVLPLILAAHA